MNVLRNDSANLNVRKLAIFICMCGMLAGLLFSRALLSSVLIVFILLSIVHKNILQQLKVFFASPFLWSMSLLFLLPFISGLWSEDIHRWSQILRIKLPLALLPVCFAGINDFNFKDWKRLSFVFLFLIFVGVCTSLWQYFQNIDLVHAAYLKAQTISTPLGNDHVRFSLLVTVAAFTIFFLLWKESGVHKKIFIVLLYSMAIIFILYLQVLAVRTGLFCFYIGSFVFILWVLFKKKNLKYWLLLVLLLFFPLIAYFIFPTFKNRISYFKYDLSFVQKNIYRPGSNDGNRTNSLKAGWQLMNQHPFVGVGFGDIKTETDKFYDNNYPGTSEPDKILPSSEWMMYGAGNGWPGFVLFTMVMLAFLFITELRKNIFWWLMNLFFALSYLFDIGLEVQFGIFLHAFILLWWYKWLRVKE